MHQLLVLNAGSSSLRFAVFDGQKAGSYTSAAYRGMVDRIGQRAKLIVKNSKGEMLQSKRLRQCALHVDALSEVLDWITKNKSDPQIAAAGHRVVHGGREFTKPILIKDTVLQKLDDLSTFAPLHQPQALSIIRALKEIDPQMKQIACFDTGFHAAQSKLVRTYALPEKLTKAGLMRYGFHGLSYEYIAAILPQYLGKTANGRVLVAHLGSGASLCALRNRQSVATTMGFTPLDGLPMATRCGNLDPGIILQLMREYRMSEIEISDLLYNKSGLLGVSGISGDMRLLLDNEDPRAVFAIELFCYRTACEIGALTTAMKGLDALVFTGGIGENIPVVRRLISKHMSWLGLRLDEGANLAGNPCISHTNSKISAWVLATDEEQVIAQHTLQVLK